MNFAGYNYYPINLVEKFILKYASFRIVDHIQLFILVLTE